MKKFDMTIDLVSEYSIPRDTYPTPPGFFVPSPKKVEPPAGFCVTIEYKGYPEDYFVFLELDQISKPSLVDMRAPGAKEPCPSRWYTFHQQEQIESVYNILLKHTVGTDTVVLNSKFDRIRAAYNMTANSPTP